MPAGSVLIKILVLATLLMGSLSLLASLRSSARRGSRRYRLRSALARLGQSAAAAFAESELAAFAAVNAKEDRPHVPGRIYKTDEEWRALLTDEQYRVTRRCGTERPFTGAYHDLQARGVYVCVCCGNPVFSSDAKFVSDSGWPSFWQPVPPDAVDDIKDISYGMVRTEIICNRCEAHLGHVFPDGPPPTGLRYCINSAALDFVAADSAEAG